MPQPESTGNESRLSEQRADLRILQANERTALAWIRTALALMAFGFVVARMGDWLRELGARTPPGHWPLWIGVTFLALGAACNAAAAIQYVRIRKAILEGRHILPGIGLVVTVALFLTTVATMLVAYVMRR